MSATSSKHPGLDVGERTALPAGDAEHDLFGFWMFLMSDAVIFALLFATYGVMMPATAGGPGPREILELRPAFIETLLLLTSSFTWGMASIALKHDLGRTPLLAAMGATLALGAAFLWFEGHDFATMFAQGAYPTRSGYLSAFFALVPLHGLHVLAGCLWIVIMAAQVVTFGLDSRVTANLLRLGLFWHFLDIVWIVIFSVVYLAGHTPGGVT
jgi:cytochrome o ubiquinol oxidase subunit 3